MFPLPIGLMCAAGVSFTHHPSPNATPMSISACMLVGELTSLAFEDVLPCPTPFYAPM